MAGEKRAALAGSADPGGSQLLRTGDVLNQPNFSAVFWCPEWIVADAYMTPRSCTGWLSTGHYTDFAGPLSLVLRRRETDAISIRSLLYSARKASIGSTPAARRAGTSAATRPPRSISSAAALIDHGSFAFTP